jgi:hypothetical protein
MPGRDGIAGLVILVASLALFVRTLGLKANALVPVGPGFYPRIVLGVTAAFALLLIVSDWRARRRRVRVEAEGPRPRYATVALHFAIFGLYSLVLPALGFRIATFAFVAVTNAVMAPPQRATQWVRVFLLASITAFVTWLVFERYLSVLLPRGAWTDY